MGVTKRSGSRISSHQEAKRPKHSVESEFDAQLDVFLKLLDGVPTRAYHFLDKDNHYFWTQPTEVMNRISLLKFLLEVDQVKRESAVNVLRGADVTIPLYRDMQHINEFKQYFPVPITRTNDMALQVQEALVAKLKTLLELGDSMFGSLVDLPSPAAFGKSGGWHTMQANDRVAIACHRPAARRPSLPLKVKHRAFFEFFNIMSATPTCAELGPFRLAAMALGSMLTAPVETEATRGCNIFEVFKQLFPESDGFRWTMENNFKQGRIDIICNKETDDRGSCPWIIIEVKLEPGTNGDGHLQLCRMYDVYVRSNDRIPLSGAPLFLLSISGMCAVYLFQ